MAATGRVYDNIRFEQLGSILGLDVTRVEKVRACTCILYCMRLQWNMNISHLSQIAAAMITENRLKASIDQTGTRLFFFI